MESEESKHVRVNENRKSPLQIPRVFGRLVELPIVKSACEQISDMYERTKEKSLVSMVGLSAAEVSIKAVLVAAKVTYTALPTSGSVGKLKESFEEKVSQADTMACHGLEFLENKWPIIKDDADKVMALGAEKLEQSDFVEVLLTVTEAAADYFKPWLAPQEKPSDAANTEPPVIQTKVDRLQGVSTILIGEGGKVLSLVASVPGRVTMAGLDGAKTVALWSLDVTQSLFHQFPVVEEMLAVFWDRANNDRYLFRPPILDDREGRELVGRKQKLRRSSRYKPKCDYQRMIDASEPFPVSPERKRKYDKEDEVETLIVQLIDVNDGYVSEEDPDYVPDNDEQEESESSEEEEDHEDESEDDEEVKISDINETKMKETPAEAQSKEAEVKVSGKETVSSKIETKKEKDASSKTGERSDHSVKKEEKKIEDKSPVSQKTENDATKVTSSTEKNGGASKIEGRIIV